MVKLLTRWKLYLMVGGAFLLGVIGLRAKWTSDGQAKQRDKAVKDRLRAVEKAQEVRNEVEALDVDTLKQRASKWVRGPDR